MFRYQYTATISRYVRDENGDLKKSDDETFLCDYQPDANNMVISKGGSDIPISYILFVPESCIIDFEIGNEIKCNGSSGTIVLVVPTHFGKQIYVK